jgi:pyrroloquinoline-quinone synthase
MTPAQLETRLQRILDERYHQRHPFNLRMHAGTLTPREVRTWVRNRYYYQTRIPIKDGLILGKAEDPAFRRQWIRRIHDHDDPSGGLELWLLLAEAVGLARDEVASLRNVLPGVRRACDAYVDFVAGHDLLASVAASLTELRAGGLMGERIAVFERHYPWVETSGLAYFRARTAQAPRDAREGLAFVLERATSDEDRERCAAALERKCEILWSLLDAVEWAATRPRLAPAAKLDLRPGEALVVLPERAVQLNETGREVVALCDGTRTIDEIAEVLRGRHAGAEGLERGVYDFLEAMERQGVLASGAVSAAVSRAVP